MSLFNKKKTAAATCSAVNSAWGPPNPPFQTRHVFFQQKEKPAAACSAVTVVGVTNPYQNAINTNRYLILANTGIK